MKKIVKCLLALSIIGSQLIAASYVSAEDETMLNSTNLDESGKNYYEIDWGEGPFIANADNFEEQYIILNDNTLQLCNISSDVSSFVVPKTITAVKVNIDEVKQEFIPTDDVKTYTVTDININSNQLSDITIPDTVTKITKLQSQIKKLYIPDSVTEISSGAFKGNDKNIALEEVYLPAQLQKIENGVFEGCTRLNRVELPESLKEIGNSAFRYCTNLKNITLPNTVTTIGEYAFSDSGLVTLTLPDNLTTLGESAFLRCNELQNITFGTKLETIPESAFRECSSLEEIVIPEGTKKIEEKAFASCYSVKSIELPSTLTNIEKYSFGLPYGYIVSSQLKSIQYKYNGTALNIDKDAFKCPPNAEAGEVPLGNVTVSIRLLNGANDSNAKAIFEGIGFQTISTEASIVQFKIGDQVIKESINKGEDTILPDQVKNGWYGFEGNINESTTEITLTKKVFNIKYELDNGTLENKNPETFSFEDRNTKLYNPTKEGYEFVGWYVESDDESSARIDNLSQLSAGNKTLVAKWTPLKNYVTNLDVQTTDNQEIAQYSSRYYTNQDVKITFKVYTSVEPNPGDWYYGNFVTASGSTPIGEWNKIDPNDGIYTITLKDSGRYVIKFKNICDGTEKVYNDTVEITIDRVKPKMTFRQPLDNVYFGVLLDVSDPTDNHGLGMNYVYVNEEIIEDFSKDGAVNGNTTDNPIKVIGFVDKDTKYTVKAIDKAGNFTTETVTLKGVPTIDDVTFSAEMLETIGDIRNEFDAKVKSGFFDGQEDLKNQIETRILALENRYQDLVVKAPIDELMKVSVMVTEKNVNSGNIAMLKELRKLILDKYEAIENKETYEVTQATVEAEINRIDNVVKYYENIMKQYHAIEENAKAYITEGIKLGNISDGKTIITSIDQLFKDYGANVTAEEMAVLNGYKVTIERAISELETMQKELQSKVEEAEKQDFKKYSEDSVKKVQTAIDEAKKALEDKNSTQAILKEKLDALDAAINGLVEKTKDDSKIEVVENTPNIEKTPDTGDNYQLFGLTCGFIVSAGAILYLSKKKNELKEM